MCSEYVKEKWLLCWESNQGLLNSWKPLAFVKRVVISFTENRWRKSTSCPQKELKSKLNLKKSSYQSSSRKANEVELRLLNQLVIAYHCRGPIYYFYQLDLWGSFSLEGRKEEDSQKYFGVNNSSIFLFSLGNLTGNQCMHVWMISFMLIILNIFEQVYSNSVTIFHHYGEK